MSNQAGVALLTGAQKHRLFNEVQRATDEIISTVRAGVCHSADVLQQSIAGIRL